MGLEVRPADERRLGGGQRGLPEATGCEGSYAPWRATLPLNPAEIKSGWRARASLRDGVGRWNPNRCSPDHGPVFPGYGRPKCHPQTSQAALESVRWNG